MKIFVPWDDETGDLPPERLVPYRPGLVLFSQLNPGGARDPGSPPMQLANDTVSRGEPQARRRASAPDRPPSPR
jgi:hypothetical protein